MICIKPYDLKATFIVAFFVVLFSGIIVPLGRK